MKNKIALAGALLLCTAASAQTPAPPTPSQVTAGPPATQTAATMSSGHLDAADQRFVMKAASGGLAEVQAAQLAQQKSQDEKVKDFAQVMITDHTAANEQLAKIAQQRGITVPAAPDAKDQAQLDKLQKLDGAKFDRVYLKSQLRDHETMLKLLQTEANNSKDADLKSFAEQTIPTIQKHLDMAKSDTTS